MKTVKAWFVCQAIGLLALAVPCAAGIYGVPTNLAADGSAGNGSPNPPGFFNLDGLSNGFAGGDGVHQIRLMIEVTSTTLDVMIFDPGTSGARDLGDTNTNTTYTLAQSLGDHDRHADDRQRNQHRRQHNGQPPRAVDSTLRSGNDLVRILHDQQRQRQQPGFPDGQRARNQPRPLRAAHLHIEQHDRDQHLRRRHPPGDGEHGALQRVHDRGRQRRDRRAGRGRDSVARGSDQRRGKPERQHHAAADALLLRRPRLHVETSNFDMDFPAAPGREAAARSSIRWAPRPRSR